jgi:hypothetical protein
VSVYGGPDKKKHNIPESLIPSQLPFLSASEKAQKAAGKAGSSAAVIGNVLFNFALSASLNQLWSLINTQQIIITIPLFDMVLPDNAAAFFGFLFPIAAFDILDTDDFWKWALNVTPPNGLSPNFEAVGFETILFLNNLGTMFFIILAFPGLMLLALLLRRCRKYQTVRIKVREIEAFVYWSGTLRIILESYTILAICSFINFTDLTFEGYGLSIISVTAICIMVFTTIFPFAVYLFLYKNYDLIKSGDEHFENRFGALWEGIKINETTEGYNPLLYIFWFMFRRYLLGILAVIFQKYLIF